MSAIELRRYTSLPFLIDMLKWSRLTLVNPAKWDDKNDSFFITTYKKTLELKTVLALCFAEYHETSYHWQIYSGGINGVCIVFNKDSLLNQLNNIKGIRSGYVNYKLKDELKVELKDDLFNQLPFTKRYGFSGEKEFRILYENKEVSFTRKDIKLDLNCIDRVMFNPWLPNHVYKSIRETIKEMNGMGQLRILQSTLTNDKTWKKWGSEISNLYKQDFQN